MARMFIKICHRFTRINVEDPPLEDRWFALRANESVCRDRPPFATFSA